MSFHELELVRKEIAVGRLIVTEFISLDGVVEDPGGGGEGKDRLLSPTLEGFERRYSSVAARLTRELFRAPPR
jgi:hypothetical protein